MTSSKPGADTASASELWLSGSARKDGARDLLSGMISGFFCKILEYPFDTIKVLEQTGGSKYSGPIDAARKTIAKSGVCSLYNGLTAPLLGSMAECASLFVAYGLMKNVLGVDEEAATLADNVPMWKYVVAGGGSGCASTCVLTPVELVKCRLQAQLGAAAPAVGTTPFTGPGDVITRTLRAEGLAGLFRGNLSTLAREIPGNMAWFGAYEFVLRAVQHRRGFGTKKEVPLYWSAFAGSWAGAAYWGVPYPADTVKSKIQTDERFRGRSFAQVFRVVLREEGLAGLYRGCLITCARAVPSHAAIFYVYEVASQRLARY